MNRKFRLFVSVNEFLNNVYAPSDLESLVKRVDGIVSPRDIVSLCSTGGGCSVELMKQTWLEGILRGVKNKEGREVYSNASIQVGRITPTLVDFVQTFVQSDKLLSFSDFVKFLAEYGINGIKEVGGLVIRYENDSNGDKFISFYVPPILEVIESSYLFPVLEKLENRLQQEGSYVILPGYFGVEILNLREILAYNYKKANNGKITVMRDGTHRSFLTHISGTTIKIIKIENSEATPTGALIPIEKIVVTKEKPKRKEDRFLGYNVSSWLEYKSVGIDG